MAFVIIPVRAELDNGNLPALLPLLRAQSAPVVPVVIVNNSEADAAYGSPAFHENRRTLEWLAAAGGRMIVVDRTAGFPRNMGMLRNLGMAAARKAGAADDSPLIHLDADCRIGQKFVARVARALSSHPFSVQPMLYLPFDDDPYIRETFFTHHLPLLGAECVRLLAGLPAARTGGPQLAATAGLWDAVGGFPELVEGEDFAAGQRLAAAAGHACLADPEALVLTADRVRETGFESTARAGMKNSGLSTTGPPCDNPLFQLAVQTARGGLSLPDGLRVALNKSFGITLPRSGEALPGIAPLVAGPVAQESLITRLLALFHPGAEARLGALQAAIGERCVLPCGNAEERHLYLRLAAIMLFLLGQPLRGGC